MAVAAVSPVQAVALSPHLPPPAAGARCGLHGGPVPLPPHGPVRSRGCAAPSLPSRVPAAEPPRGPQTVYPRQPRPLAPCRGLPKRNPSSRSSAGSFGDGRCYRGTAALAQGLGQRGAGALGGCGYVSADGEGKRKIAAGGSYPSRARAAELASRHPCGSGKAGLVGNEHPPFVPRVEN